MLIFNPDNPIILDDSSNPTAVATVFHTFELLENILLRLPEGDILRCQRLN
jgi:hypothetical protein